MNHKYKITSQWFLYSVVITAIIIFSCILIPNDYEYASVIGVMLIVVSGLNVFFCRDNKMLLVLFAIILYINVSITIPGFINHGNTLASYQRPLWESEYSTIYAKCLFIVSAIFSIFFYDTAKHEDQNSKVINRKFLMQYDNTFLSFLSFAILVLIFVFCFDGTSVLTGGVYSSNNNAIYEYSIFFFALAWLYGSSKIYVRIIWYILAFYYIAIGVITGDRSSCFMVIVMIVLYLWKGTNTLKIAIYSFVGIVFANSIAILRNLNNYIGARNIIGMVLSNGYSAFLSDTAYYSCHSGLTILAYSDLYNGSKLLLLIKWIISLFTGSIFIKGNEYELVVAARQYNYNGGGGVFPAYFYFYGGLIGVAIATIITAIIIRKIFFYTENRYSLILRYIIPSTALRWYLYSPTTLYRSCLINFGIIYLFFVAIDSTIVRTYK